MIYPHRNGFAAYVWVMKPDGKRTRKYVYGKTREEVHDKWVKLHAEAAKGPVATKTPTIASYAAYWLEEIVKPNLSPGTYVAYEVACRLYIVPGLGKKKLNLPARDAQTWINEVARTCQCCAQGRDERRPKGKRRCCAVRRCCKSTLSPTSLGHIRRTLRSMLGQAMMEETASRNVAKHLRLPVQRPARRNSWGTDDARKFLESARADGDPLYAAYVLVLVLGLRKGEMLGLTDDAIDWAGWDRRCKEHRESFCVDCVAEYDVTLQIDRQLQRIGSQLLHRETKTPTSDAGLPLPPICAVAVRQRHLDTERDSAEAGPLWHGLRLLFTTKFGIPIEPRNFNRYWDRRCLAAGVPRITVRDARRTCGQVSSQKTRDALRRLGAREKFG